MPFVNLADETTSNAETNTLPYDIPYFMNQHEKELCKGKQNNVIINLGTIHIWCQLYLFYFFIEPFTLVLHEHCKSSDKACSEIPEFLKASLFRIIL